jgi:hypothetical protein
MKKRALLLAGFVCALLWTMTAAAAPTQKEHALKVGKKGEITLTRQTKIGNIVLQPDTYVIQHRVSGGNHFVRFVELKQVEAQPANAEQSPYTYTEADKAGEVNCRIEPAAGPVKETTAYTVADGGKVRITKVAIKGEDVLHVF